MNLTERAISISPNIVRERGTITPLYYVSDGADGARSSPHVEIKIVRESKEEAIDAWAVEADICKGRMRAGERWCWIVAPDMEVWRDHETMRMRYGIYSRHVVITKEENENGDDTK